MKRYDTIHLDWDGVMWDFKQAFCEWFEKEVPDTDKWEFVDSPGLVYHFPRSIDCEVIYCNIEGVTFLEGNRIMTTSDASKSAQSYNCVEKAQSVQVNPPRGTTSLRDAPDPARC